MISSLKEGKRISDEGKTKAWSSACVRGLELSAVAHRSAQRPIGTNPQLA
jgi:hypothetical protein